MATHLKVTVVQGLRLALPNPEKAKLVVIVEYKDRKVETEEHREPKWGQTFEFALGEKDRLSPGELNVYIWNRFGKQEKFLGRATVSLMDHATVSFSNAQEKRYDLVGSGAPKEKISGQIGLAVGYVLPSRRVKESRSKQTESATGRKLASMGYYDVNDRRNTESILDEADEIARESVASVQRSIRRLEDASTAGAETEAMLHDQGLQIQRIQASLDDVGQMQQQAAKHTKAIDSIFGAVENAFEDAVDKVVPFGKAGARADTNAAASDRVARQKRANEKKTRGGKGSSFASDEGGLTKDEMEVLRPETQDNVRAIDAGLDRMTYLLEDLDIRAKNMNQQIEEQNTRLGYLRGTMDKASIKSRSTASKNRTSMY